MKKTVAPAPVAAGPLAGESAGRVPAAAQLHPSPYMVAQRAQLAGAFGTAQLADKKKLPAQRKADPAAQLKGEKKKPGQK
jgi:hypothetical protein